MILPVEYFHVVFTTDHLLNALARANPQAIYNLMFEAAWQSLKAFGRKYLGGEIGGTAVLHTWGETLIEHLHTHWIVPGGVLVRNADGSYSWVSARAGYLFPVVAMSRHYRDYLCDGLLKLWRKGELKLEGECAGLDVEALVAEMRSKAWEVYIKPAYGEGTEVFEYPARYFNRVAFSNYRIVSIANGQVTFKYHDNRDGGREKLMRLDAFEFIRRFMLHIVPAHFVRVRHYGLHHSSKRRELSECRRLLGLSAALPQVKPLIMVEWLGEILGRDPKQCPFCGQGRMVMRAEFGPVWPVWMWVWALIGISMGARVKD